MAPVTLSCLLEPSLACTLSLVIRVVNILPYIIFDKIAGKEGNSLTWQAALEAREPFSSTVHIPSHSGRLQDDRKLSDKML